MREHTCGILDTGIVACWGLDDQSQSIPPGGTFTGSERRRETIPAGFSIRATVECWGLDDQGQAASPDPAAKMDLVIHSPRVSDNSPSTEASFTLSVTVRNNGVEASTPTTLALLPLDRRDDHDIRHAGHDRRGVGACLFHEHQQVGAAHCAVDGWHRTTTARAWTR